MHSNNINLEKYTKIYKKEENANEYICIKFHLFLYFTIKPTVIFSYWLNNVNKTQVWPKVEVV